MSFEVHLQGFDDDPVDRWDAIEPVLRDVLAEDEANLRTRDGGAEIYGLSDEPLAGIMISGAEGNEIWDVIVAIARAADWAIMPVGCPVCIVSEEMRDALPEELVDDEEGVVLVRSGAELLAVIEAV